MCKRTQKTTHGKCSIYFDDTIGLAATLDRGAAILYLRPDNGSWCEYWVKWTKNAAEQVTGFTLNKITSNPEHEAIYTIDASFGPLPAHWFCDCYSDHYRKPGMSACKHIRGIWEALSHHGLLSISTAPVKQEGKVCEMLETL